MLQKLFNRFPAIAGGLGVACLLAGIGTYLVTADFDRRVWVLLVAGVALLLIVASYYPQELMQALRGRQARYGSNTLAMVLVFLAIVSLVNFLSVKRSYRLDLTEAKEHTLSAQTFGVLDKLQGPVKIASFYAQGQGGKTELEDMLKEYRRYSEKVSYEFIDPELSPAVARQYKIQNYGTTVVEYQGKRQDVMGIGEQDVTSAILKMSRGASKKVYFLAGHGEIDIGSFERTGGDEAKKALQADNYEVAPLTLASAGSVPEDAAVLVIAGPKNPFLAEEKKAVQAYLEKGGKAFILVEPNGSPSMVELLQEWGIEVGAGVIIDPGSSLANQPQVPVIVRYKYSQITKDLQALQQMTLFPLATSVSPKKELPKGVTVSSLIETTDRSWLETDPQVARYDEGVDVKGPLNLAVTVQTDAGSQDQPQGKSNPEEKSKPKTRMVVIGDVDFAGNDLLREPAIANKDLFLNAVNWLAEEEELITIRAKEPTNRTIFLAGSDMNFVFYSSVIFLPLAVLLVGGAVWWSRR